MFQEKDLEQFKSLGIDENQVKEQIQTFEKGITPVRLVRAATAQDGIHVFGDNKLEELAVFYDKNLGNRSIQKFVPASGAATRMFKSYFAFLDGDGKPEPGSDMDEFFQKVHEFAFFDDLLKVLEPSNTERLKASGEYKKIVAAVLNEEGLNYGNLPKGLIKFHYYPEGSRTPFEEHMVEGAMHAKDAKGNVNIHFTVSPEHQPLFESLLKSVKSMMEKKFSATYNITFSQQLSSTDTVAVGMDNKPFRNADGSILFRPGGHGALLYNLNDLDADLIFVKNIDNMIPDRLRKETILNKKALAGLTIQIQEKVFEYVKKIDDKQVDESAISEIASFIKKSFFIDLQNDLNGKSVEEQLNVLHDFLDRPLRVCGMVKSEGDTGGGPFWIVKNGVESLQVVETAQIDLSDAGQKEIFSSATHFNPVDIVCGIKNYKGEKYKLQEFKDPEAGFISKKSKDGKDLKALEHPGLWNGAMAHWLTAFVEVPLITFNPVKTLNDLLGGNHVN